MSTNQNNTSDHKFGAIALAVGVAALAVAYFFVASPDVDLGRPDRMALIEFDRSPAPGESSARGATPRIVAAEDPSTDSDESTAPGAQSASSRAAELLRRQQNYALLVPSKCREQYSFVVEQLRQFSERARAGLPEPEGWLMNNVFFAAGSHGRLPEFRESWEYILRSLGIVLSETQHVQLMAELALFWEEGASQMRDIEHAELGAPLEGGQSSDWPVFPDTEALIRTWDRRNALGQSLFLDWMDIFGAVLSVDEFAIVVRALDTYGAEI